MSTSKAKPGTVAEQILVCLASGEKTKAEILESVSGKSATIDTNLARLKNSGKIESVRHGLYRLPGSGILPVLAVETAEKIREEADNIATINKMLNLYDKVIDNTQGVIDGELSTTVTISERIDLIKGLRWLGATVDQLMKRWYLVHRGYDANTRQAQEDAKEKTAAREKQALDSAAPEDKVVLVGDYHESVKAIWDSLPESEQAERTV